MLWAALLALAASGAAVRLAARRRGCPDLRAAALLLEALLAADLARLLLSALVLDPARAAGRLPYAGAERLAFHATQLAFLAWPLGVVALCWHLFTRRRPVLWVAVPWAACAIRIAAGYPALRGAALAESYRWHLLVSLGLACLALLGERPAGFRPGRAHLAALLLLAGLAAEVLGPFLAAPFASWWTAQASWTLVLAAVALAAAGRRPPWIPSPGS